MSDLAEELIKEKKERKKSLAEELIEIAKAKRQPKIVHPELQEFIVKPEITPAPADVTKPKEKPVELLGDEKLIAETKEVPITFEPRPVYYDATTTPLSPPQKIETDELADPTDIFLAEMITGSLMFPILYLDDLVNYNQLTAQRMAGAVVLGNRIITPKDPEWAEIGKIHEGQAINLLTETAGLAGMHLANIILTRTVTPLIKGFLFNKRISPDDFFKIVGKVGRGEKVTDFEFKVWNEANALARENGISLLGLYKTMKESGGKIIWDVNLPSRTGIGKGGVRVKGVEVPKDIPDWFKPKEIKPITGKVLNPVELINKEADQIIKQGTIPAGIERQDLVIALEKRIIEKIVLSEDDYHLFIEGFSGDLRKKVLSGGYIDNIVSELQGRFYKTYGKPITPLMGETTIKKAPITEPAKPIAGTEPKFELTKEEYSIIKKYVKVVKKILKREEKDPIWPLLEEYNNIRGQLEPIKKKYPEIVNSEMMKNTWMLGEDFRNSNQSLRTGLLSKNLFITRLPDYMEERRGFLFLDLIGLHDINNKYGHATGDKVIGALSKTIKEFVKKNDGVMAFDWGGDEFMIVLNTNQTLTESECKNLCNTFIKLAKEDAPYVDYKYLKGFRYNQGVAVPGENLTDFYNRIDPKLAKKDFKEIIGDVTTGRKPNEYLTNMTEDESAMAKEILRRNKKLRGDKEPTEPIAYADKGGYAKEIKKVEKIIETRDKTGEFFVYPEAAPPKSLIKVDNDLYSPEIFKEHGLTLEGAIYDPRTGTGRLLFSKGDKAFTSDVKEAEKLFYILRNFDCDNVYVESALGEAMRGDLSAAIAQKDKIFTMMDVCKDFGGYANTPNSVLAIAMPEMVEFIVAVHQGKYPKVVKKAKWPGMFKPKGGGEIFLRADIFQDMPTAMKTLAHEIGHYLPWIPDEVLEQSEILRRMVSLYNQMKPDYKIFSKNKVIMDELKKLTQIWKPFDEGDIKLRKYRHSPEELYADAVSVLFNDPQLLETTAPNFYREFFEHLRKKPKVWEKYLEILKICEDENVLLEHRQVRMREMWARGEDVWAVKRLEVGKKKEGIIERLAYEQYNKGYGIEKIAAKGKKMGVITPETNPAYAYEELGYYLSEVEKYYEMIDDTYKFIKNNDLTWEDLADVLFHERVIYQREGMASPGGMNPITSQRQLDYLRTKLGEEKWNKLTTARDMFRDAHKYIIDRMEEAKIVSPEQIKQFRDEPHYAAFVVLDYYEKDFGIELSSQIFPQYGTLQSIMNPATATIMKDSRILKAINQKEAMIKLVDAMKLVVPDEIKPAELKFNGKRMVPIKPSPMSGLGLISYPHNGELVSYYVPKRLADAFHANPEEVNLIISAISMGNEVFKELFIYKNIGWIGTNFFRDLARTSMNTPGWLYIINVLPDYVKAFKPAHRKILGIHDEVIDKMRRLKCLPAKAGRWGTTTAQKQEQALLERHGFMKRETYGKAIKPFVKFLQGIETGGEFSEVWSKTAGFLKLKRSGYSDIEAAHFTRTCAGTPNYTKKGTFWAQSNNIFLLSNVWLQGWAGNWEAFTTNKAQYIAKLIQHTLVTTFLKYGAAIGLLGLGIKRIMDGVSEYDMTNYIIVPLGLTENGKSVYLRVPQDEVSRVINGIIWKALQLRQAKDIADVLDYGIGQVPTLTPSITIPLDVIQYAAGKNIYNSFYGDYAIDKDVREVGGWRSHEQFLKYLWHQGGLNIIYRFPTRDEGEVKTTLEKITGLPIIGNIVGRFIKVSDKGIREKVHDVINAVQVAEMQQRFLVEDAVLKIIKGHKLNDNEWIAIASHPELFEKKLEGLMISNYGPLAIELLRKAQTDEERIAALKKIVELNIIEE